MQTAVRKCKKATLTPVIVTEEEKVATGERRS